MFCDVACRREVLMLCFSHTSYYCLSVHCVVVVVVVAVVVGVVDDVVVIVVLVPLFCVIAVVAFPVLGYYENFLFLRKKRP